jgi:hypothetical protein
MRKEICGLLLMGLALLCGSATSGADATTRASKFRLDSMEELEAVNIKPEVAIHEGRRAVRLLNSREDATIDLARQSIAILSDSEFKDGTIEAELAGEPRAGAAPDIRGFIGIAFRVQEHGKRFECFYLRMTNGRADDQLRRNHSAQYISAPDFPWERLRKENPGVYESYVDVEPGRWTKIKIVVAGTKAQLFVNGASQPCLVVNDLKLGEGSGQVALWVADDTDAYFSTLTVK